MESNSLRPNVLWIVTTQWRAQAAGFAGDPNARTPHLDRFAEEAAVIRHAVSNHPFGPFARASLLTSLHPHGHGVRDYFDPLDGRVRTVAHELRTAGYQTAYFGKWHLHRRSPTEQLVGPAHASVVIPEESRGGFQIWDAFESGFLINDPILHGTRRGAPVQVPGYQSDVLVRSLLEYLEQEAIAPWFAVLSLEPPHPPYGSAAAGIAPRPSASIRLAPNVTEEPVARERARAELAGYYAHIEATDRALGRVFACLDQRDLRSRTLVVVTSSHGDMHGAHGYFRKGWPFEESIRVPLLFRWPGVVRSGERSDGVLSLVDVGSTTLALVGAPVPAGVHGRSAAEWVATGAPASPAAALLGMPSVPPFPLQCDRRWSGIRTTGHLLALDEGGSPWLCFDLERDPWQQRNLAQDSASAGLLAHLGECLLRELDRVGAP